MKSDKAALLLFFPLSFFSACMQMKYGWDVKTPEQLYSDCMSTFSDEVKCHEFISKDAVKAKATESQYPQLSEEERSKLLIRQDLKDKVQYKNKLFVKHLIGEPDEIQYVNNVHEDWIYRRPISVFELGYAPDKEIRIRFQKGNVQKVNHKGPDKVPN